MDESKIWKSTHQILHVCHNDNVMSIDQNIYRHDA